MLENRSIDVFTKLYKPYKITKINKVFLFYTEDGDYVIKLNPKINYFDLSKYLESMGINCLPNLSLDSRDDMIVMDYVSSVDLDSSQKAFDMIDLVSSLHDKTSYYKEVTNDKYKELYDSIYSNIISVQKYYDDLFELYLNESYNSPSHYLLLRNYSTIYGAINYSLDKLGSWYNLVKDKREQRVCLVHNNLKLEHYLKNNKDYLVSFDNYLFDSPVLDLYRFYLNEWEDVPFKEIFLEYERNVNLSDDEKILLYLLISIPSRVTLCDSDYDNCFNIRRMINYLNKSSSIVL